MTKSTDMHAPPAPGGAPSRVGSLASGIRQGLRLMTAKERQIAALLVFSSMINAVLQTAALVAIVPVIQIMVGTKDLPRDGVFAWMLPLIENTDSAVFLYQLAGAVAALTIAKALFGWLHLGWMARFSARCEVRLSGYLMRRVLNAHYSWLVRQNSSRLRQLMFGFVSIWSRDFIRSLMKLLNDFLFAAFIISAMVWANPTAGLIVTTCGTLLAIAIFLFIRPELLRLAFGKRRAIIGANTISTEAILGAKDVKMAGAEAYFADLFDEQVKGYSYADAKAQQWGQFPRIVLEFVAFIALIGLSVGIVVIDLRDPQLGTILLLYGLAVMRLLPIFSTAIGGLTSLLGSFPLITDLEQLIASTTNDTKAPALDPPAWSQVQLRNVSFHYDTTDKKAVRQVSLSIQGGHTYGVVGPSGAGKSTVIDLIVGLLEPSSGAVMIDGVPLVADQRHAWRKRFGYVTQRPFLLDASLRENIVFGLPRAGDEMPLKRAINLARLDKVVERLPDGLDSTVGEQGNLLSGGERQRIAIARALYRGADILILDEATSSLDTLVEAEIAESVATLRGKITTLIVSHRLALVRDCDEIWLFDNGMLDARGPHEELLQQSDLYRRMVTRSDKPTQAAIG